MTISEENIIRYSRNILLAELGPEGQEKISSSSVLVIGAGGLGSPALLYLAAAGVGKLGLADGDRVDLSNLQRQVLYTEGDLGEKKAEVGVNRLKALNRDLHIVGFPEKIDENNIFSIIEGFDLIIDGTDTFESKYLINDASVITGNPFIHSGILRFEGQLFTYVPGETGCLRCILPGVPPRKDSPTCSESGILGAVAGLFGSAQAIEALKHITGTGTGLTGKVMYVNTFDWSVRFIDHTRNMECPVCGESPSITYPLSPVHYGGKCVEKSGVE